MSDYVDLRNGYMSAQLSLSFVCEELSQARRLWRVVGFDIFFLADMPRQTPVEHGHCVQISSTLFGRP